MCAALAVMAALALDPGRAWSLTQPDGTIIPQGSGLQDMFTARGEGVSALSDAAIVPETFVPGCTLTFEVLQRNAGYQNSFGWYNVTGAAPTVADLHEVLACTDPVGTIRSVDIANHPSYLGGEVGFYQATGACATLQDYIYIFYSQRQYNPDGAGTDVYTHLLIYDSTVTPRAFYFAWEDLLSGGDNDFDDLTTFVTGITCSGGGGPCDTGLEGVCAEGTMQCRSGQLACVGSNEASAEVCDGLDNDCDGVIDDEAECPGIEVCDRGVCVPPCTNIEFPCTGIRVCQDGVCVEPDCVGVSCDPGLRCEGGECVEPCTGVVCPHGQVCRVGVCLDPCTSLACDTPQICVSGVCVDRCECTGCATEETCQASGECIATACVGNTCLASEHCAPDGTCVDDCLGATCPAGQRCEAGACVDIPPDPDAGVPPVTDSSVPPGGDAAQPSTDASGPDGGGPHNNGGMASGCNCKTGGQAPGAGALVALLLLVLLARQRRRSR